MRGRYHRKNLDVKNLNLNMHKYYTQFVSILIFQLKVVIKI